MRKVIFKLFETVSFANIIWIRLFFFADRFADVELDALRSSITALSARMKRFAHPAIGSAAGTGMSTWQTPKVGRSHVSDSQMSLLKSSLEKLSLLNEENNVKLRLIEHELKNQEQ